MSFPIGVEEAPEKGSMTRKTTSVYISQKEKSRLRKPKNSPKKNTPGNYPLLGGEKREFEKEASPAKDLRRLPRGLVLLAEASSLLAGG